MYCVSCGSQNPDFGKFCHRCGQPLHRPPARKPPHVRSAALDAEADLFMELLQTDPLADQCHQCGATGDLTRYRFGFARALSVKRDWTETVSRAAVSALSIALAPVTGFAAFSWKGPDKTVSYSVLRAELVLCADCLGEARGRSGGKPSQEHYTLHPWSEKARRLGYATYLSAEDMAKLTPISKRIQ